MEPVLFAAVAALTIVAVIVTAFFSFIYWERVYRGQRLVDCPETRLPVAVEIDPLVAGRSALVGRTARYVITSCTRWPEKADCDQACVAEIAADPEATRVQTIVARWYAEKPCAYCGRAIGEIDGPAVVPALRTPDGELRPWSEIAALDLKDVLSRSAAVCANCEVPETFRRRFPDLVTDRQADGLRDSLVH